MQSLFQPNASDTGSNIMQHHCQHILGAAQHKIMDGLHLDIIADQERETANVLAIASCSAHNLASRTDRVKEIADQAALLINEGLDLTKPLIKCNCFNQTLPCANNCDKRVTAMLAPMQERDIGKRWEMIRELMRNHEHEITLTFE